MKTTSPKVYPEAILEIEHLSHEGRGISHLQDKTTFIDGALPQEEVKCKITKRHSRYNEAETIEVLRPSSDRTTPLCPHFGVCGGCSLQHMQMDAQLAFKQNVLLEQLKHFGQVTPETLLPPLSGHSWHYRRKARLGVRYVKKKEKLLVGFREKSSSFLADMQTCHVLDKRIGMHLEDLSKVISGLSQYDQIAQVEVAASDNQIALVFRHLKNLLESDIQQLMNFGQRFNFHIYLQPNPPANIHKIYPQGISDRLTYTLPDYQLTFEFHPLDFTQINGEINPLMIRQALAFLAPNENETILDLFCGLGNFTLPIARFAKKVVGVEGSSEMVTRAEQNALANQLTNTAFYAANLMSPDVSAPWMQHHYDKILLDPPRTGAAEIIPFFPQFSAKRIIYISCNPATLARDAKELVHNQHYKLQASGIINMFPHTSHIEAMAVFEK